MTKIPGLMYFLLATATQPKIVSGTVKLINAVSGWLLILAPLTGAAFGIFHAIKKSSAEDDMAIAKHQKMIHNSITGVIWAMTISGLITVISSYYK
jgi:hypothetical protein